MICYSIRDKTEGWGLGEQRREEEKKPILFSARYGLFLNRRCLLELGVRILQQMQNEVRRGSSVGSTGAMGKREVRLQLEICCSAS